MSARYTTTGNNRPHIVATSYQHTTRVPGPLTHDKRPLNYWLVAAPIGVAFLFIMAGLWT